MKNTFKILIVGIIIKSTLIFGSSPLFFQLDSSSSWTYKTKSTTIFNYTSQSELVINSVIFLDSTKILRKIFDSNSFILDTCNLTDHFDCNSEYLPNPSHINSNYMNELISIDKETVFNYKGEDYLKSENSYKNIHGSSQLIKIYRKNVGLIYLKKINSSTSPQNDNTWSYSLIKFNNVDFDPTLIDSIIDYSNSLTGKIKIEKGITTRSQPFKLIDLLGRKIENTSYSIQIGAFILKSNLE